MAGRRGGGNIRLTGYFGTNKASFGLVLGSLRGQGEKGRGRGDKRIERRVGAPRKP